MLNPNNSLQPSIAVIIPVYNCEQYLETAVSSVLNQPYSHIRIIIVDDGSTDGSPRLCNQLQETSPERIHVIHQANAGVSAARNRAIQYVIDKNVGGYIAFLDADDCYAPEFFDEKIIALLAKGYDLVGFQGCTANESLTVRSRTSPMQTGVFGGGTDAIWIHDEHFGSMLYSAKLLKEYGIRFPSCKHTEDRIFHTQCLFLADTCYLEEKLLYYYRIRSSSVTHTRKYGIPHFVPIIDAWIESDKAMAPYANDARGTLNEGHTLAWIFTMDMIDEHLMMLRKKSEIQEFFRQRPEYRDYLRAPLGGAARQARFERMVNHPKSYVLRQRLKGVIIYIARFVSRFKPIRSLREHFRYSIPL